MAEIRDNILLDILEQYQFEPYTGRVWRSVRDTQDPCRCWRSGGRWDDRTFDVLYTSETKSGAIKERKFHLFQGQPFRPSKVEFRIYELTVSLQNVLHLGDLETLKKLRVNVSKYGRASYMNNNQEYPNTQAIAEASYFLGADGIIVPNARHNSQNLVIFCDQVPSPKINEYKDHGILVWE